MRTLGPSILSLLFVWGALGQGAVDFRNGGIIFRTTADRRVYLCGQSTGLVGTNYAAALYYLPGSDRGAALSSPTNGLLARGSNNLANALFRSPSTSLPGIWLNSLDVGQFRYLDRVLPGASATLQVRVWDTLFYPNFQSAFLSGQYYVSPPFNYTVPTNGAPKEDYYLDDLRSSFSPCALLLSIHRNDASIVLSWAEPVLPGVLVEEIQPLTPVAASWRPVPGPFQTNQDRISITIPATAPSRFYRLHRP